jgi:hypothetical protein
MIDNVDREILGLCASPVSIYGISKQLQNKRAYSNVHNRVKDLEKLGLLKIDKQRHWVFVEITEKGQMEAQSREDRTS